MNEAEQIARAQQGDEGAWLMLVGIHQEAVFRMAWLLLDDADDADDVAQETFIRAFQTLDRFDLARPLRPWLLQIAKNLAHNRRRSVRRYIAAAMRWLETAPSSVPNPEPVTIEAQRAETLRRAVSKLRQPDQEVLYLRYFLEMSVAESAEVLDVAEGTVKSRLSRATQRLRTFIEKDFPQLREEVLS